MMFKKLCAFIMEKNPNPVLRVVDSRTPYRKSVLWNACTKKCRSR